MLKVKDLFTVMGLAVPHDRIKMVRHVDHPKKTIRGMIDAGEFEYFQSEQNIDRKLFHDCDVIISFFASADGGCDFHGVYQVNGSRAFTRADYLKAPGFLKGSLKGASDRIWYDLSELSQFNGMRGRLRATWKDPINWVRKGDVEVFELLPPGRVRNFPGYQDVVLSWRELHEICSSPNSHRDWVAALKFTAAIYRIVDLESGKIYIGSAYGKQGLWNRWQAYSKSPDGGNKMLKGVGRDRLQWSIVRTLSGVMSARDVIAIEHLEMQKHGSKAIGLNYSNQMQMNGFS